MKNIDQKKNYNRLFAFGCSLTRYMYPTYADILGQHYDNAEYINLAKPGSGSIVLMSRLTQAHRYFKFNKDDLIVIMYPSFTREDRFLKYHWECWGNVFTSGTFDYNFLRKYGDVTHYMLRDLASVDLIRTFLKTLDSNVVELMSVDHQGLDPMELELDEHQIKNHKTLQERYHDLFQGFPIDYTSWLDSIKTSHNSFGVRYDNMIDSHPKPTIALQYLQALGFQINKKAIDFAHYQDEQISYCKTRKQLVDLSENMQNFHDRYFISGAII